MLVHLTEKQESTRQPIGFSIKLDYKLPIHLFRTTNNQEKYIWSKEPLHLKALHRHELHQNNSSWTVHSILLIYLHNSMQLKAFKENNNTHNDYEVHEHPHGLSVFLSSPRLLKKKYPTTNPRTRAMKTPPFKTSLPTWVNIPALHSLQKWPIPWP